MTLSPSIDLIWRLAADEMAAGEFGEIQPEHFCMAVLKFAEVSIKTPEGTGEQADLAKAIAADAQLVREALQKCGIESTIARRKLRKQLGKGGAPHKEGKIHRSAASRTLFESANALAAESGNEKLTPLHLLTALVQSPSPAIAQAVLGKVAPQPQPATTPLLDKHGEDLVRQVAEGKLPTDSNRVAECKAILQILTGKKSAFLLSQGEPSTTYILRALANSLFSESKLQPAASHARLLDIRKMSGPLAEVDSESHWKVRDGLFAEASQCPGIILVCSVDSVFTRTEKRLDRSATNSKLARLPVRCIIPMTPEGYEALLKDDRKWTRYAEPVWLREQQKNSIPREL